MTQIVVNAGASGAARAQAQAYALGQQASTNQASLCMDERDKVKNVCDEIYRSVQGARRKNIGEREQSSQTLASAADMDHAKRLDSIQDYRSIDIQLGQILNDTRSAQQLGVQVLNDLFACQLANARIYEANATRAKQVSFAIDSNQIPPAPEDKRSAYDKFGKPLQEMAEEAAISTVISTPLSEGVRRLAPAAIGGPAGMAIDVGANVLSPTKTSKCDGLNLDPIESYNKDCRVNTLHPQPDVPARHPADDDGGFEKED